MYLRVTYYVSLDEFIKAKFKISLETFHGMLITFHGMLITFRGIR